MEQGDEIQGPTCDTLLEPGTTCMHDHENNNPNIQEFPPLKIDICTHMYLENTLEYMHKWEVKKSYRPQSDLYAKNIMIMLRYG